MSQPTTDEPELKRGRAYLNIGSGLEVRSVLALTGRRLFISQSIGALGAALTLRDRRMPYVYGKPYPLSHITKVSAQQTRLLVFSWPYLQIDFDNGGALVVRTGQDKAWAALIEETRRRAPESHYEAAPKPLTQPYRPPYSAYLSIFGLVMASLYFVICSVSMLLLIVIVYFPPWRSGLFF